VSTVLEFLDEITKTAAQHGPGPSAAEELAQSARDQVFQAATRFGGGGVRSWLTAQQPTQDIADPSARLAGTKIACHTSSAAERLPRCPVKESRQSA
jgi:hypothetical protein